MSTGPALGSTLHAWRDRLSPLDVGLSGAGPRRARGLRREELAALSGLSVDYLVRLEQGRSTSPSAQVVASLARALRLSAAERDHLHLLAGLRAPAAGSVPTFVPPSVQRLVVALHDHPVAVFAADWTLLTWNPLWASLIGDPLGVPAARRSLVHAMFLDPEGALRWPVRSEREERSRGAVVSDLRVAAATYPRDEDLAALIASARRDSPVFAGLWDTGDVVPHASDRKTVAHPLVGDVALDCDVLVVPGADLRIVAYTARPGTTDADRLDLVRVSAITTFAPAP